MHANERIAGNNNSKGDLREEFKQDLEEDLLLSSGQVRVRSGQILNMYENHDIAIAMSPSCADPVLGLNILLH